MTPFAQATATTGSHHFGVVTIVYSYPYRTAETAVPYHLDSNRAYYRERPRPSLFEPLDTNKYRAAAVPPRQPPPVALELAAYPVRLWEYDTSVSTPAIRAIPRRHARQRTCIRSRRKLRVWERV